MGGVSPKCVKNAPSKGSSCLTESGKLAAVRTIAQRSNELQDTRAGQFSTEFTEFLLTGERTAEIGSSCAGAPTGPRGDRDTYGPGYAGRVRDTYR